MFCMWRNKEKTKKIGVYEVASQVETENGYVTLTEAMTRTENSDDLWLQTAAKLLKVQINSSDMWAVHAFITKPITIDLLIFMGKYRKKTLHFTRKYQASV